MSVTPIVCDSGAWVSSCCKDEKCALCGQPASAKVVEEIFFDDAFASRHALSAYVCTNHFLQLMGPAGVTWVEGYRIKQCAMSSQSADESKNAREDDIAAILAGPAFRNTDDAPADLVLAALRQCAASWDAHARVMGNIRAEDIIRAVSEALERMASPFR